MSNFLTTAGFQSILIRKPLSGVVFVAPYSAAALALITTGAGAANTLDTATISANHKTLGKVSNDGITFGNSVSKQETRGFGDIYPARIDVDGQSVTLSWSALETNVRTIDEWTGVTQVGTGQLAATTKELIISMPPLPVIRDKRVLALFKDSNPDGTGEIFLGVYLLRANIIQNGDVSFNFTEGGLQYPLQANALNDDVAGTPVRLFMGGPGWQSLFTAMGYT
jgi:hypothetical protein